MVTALPGGGGIESLSAVRMEGELHEMHGFGTYLVAQQGKLFCVVDELLLFTPDTKGWLEEDVVLEAENAPSRIRVTAHRVLHGSLDAEEFETGVSDVEYEGCHRHVYGVTSGALARLETQKVEGPCPPTGAASAP